MVLSRFLGQCCPDGHDNDLKAARIVDRHLRELLAIEFDIGQVQTVDELAVTDAVQTSRCVESGDPQAAEIAASATTVTLSKPACSHQVFLGGPVKPTTAADVSLGPLKHPPFGLAAC